MHILRARRCQAFLEQHAPLLLPPVLWCDRDAVTVLPQLRALEALGQALPSPHPYRPGLPADAPHRKLGPREHFRIKQSNQEPSGARVPSHLVPKRRTRCPTGGGRQLGSVRAPGTSVSRVRPPQLTRQTLPVSPPRGPGCANGPDLSVRKENHRRFSAGRAVGTYQLCPAQTGHQGPVPGAPSHSSAAHPQPRRDLWPPPGTSWRRPPPEPLPPGDRLVCLPGSLSRLHRDSPRGSALQRTPPLGTEGRWPSAWSVSSPQGSIRARSITRLPRHQPRPAQQAVPAAAQRAGGENQPQH